MFNLYIRHRRLREVKKFTPNHPMMKSRSPDSNHVLSLESTRSARVKIIIPILLGGKVTTKEDAHLPTSLFPSHERPRLTFHHIGGEAADREQGQDDGSHG